VYYRKEEIPKLKEWLRDNLSKLKTISFLCHSDHGFKQSPKEVITQEQYEKGIKSLKDIDFGDIGEGNSINDIECPGGVCPVK
jgi:hypothetical protein